MRHQKRGKAKGKAMTVEETVHKLRQMMNNFHSGARKALTKAWKPMQTRMATEPWRSRWNQLSESLVMPHAVFQVFKCYAAGVLMAV